MEPVNIYVLLELTKIAGSSQYMLDICDKFTKLAKSVPAKSISASKVTKKLVHGCVLNHGPPMELLADNGKYFTPKFI